MGKTANFGEMNWGDEGASGSNRNDFFNLKDDGQYKVRIVGKPHEFAAHWVDSGMTRKKINCAGKDCVLCSKGQKASIRYLVPAIFRSGPNVEAGNLAITEFGPQVFGAIKNLFTQEDWGNPMHYDIIIDKKKSRGPSNTYFITPNPKKELSEQERMDVKEFLENVKLREFSAPLDNNAILEKLGPEACRAMGLSAPQTSLNSESEFNFESSGSSEEGSEFNFGN